jgi:hypothetical protein
MLEIQTITIFFQEDIWRFLNKCTDLPLCAFILSLQKEENYIHFQIVKVNAGEPTLQTKKYLYYSKGLKNLLLFPHITLLTQIEGLALSL